MQHQKKYDDLFDLKERINNFQRTTDTIQHHNNKNMGYTRMCCDGDGDEMMVVGNVDGVLCSWGESVC